jgi:GT2 family glycosyltransferase
MLSQEKYSILNDIPVVVLNWNGFSDTKAAVNSLLSQNLLAKVVLVDNGSEPDEIAKLKQWSADIPQVKLKLNNNNLGFAKAHNQVFKDLEEEGFRYVACLNNDAIADKNWLENLYMAGENMDASMLSSLMLMSSDNDRIDNVGHQILSTGEIFPAGSGELTRSYKQHKNSVGPCAGACLYRLEMLSQIGYFDERFFVGYEDAELGLRAWLCGYNCHHVEEARVSHKMSTSIGKIRKASYLSEIQSHIFYTWFKLMPITIVFRNLPGMIVKYSVVLMIDLLLFRFKFLKVMVNGIRLTILNWSEIKSARKTFYLEQRVTRSNSEIIAMLTPFLPFDARRFWKHIVLGKKSALEE